MIYTVPLFAADGWVALLLCGNLQRISFVFLGRWRHIQELRGHKSSKTPETYTHNLYRSPSGLPKKGWGKIKSWLDSLEI